jgi:uncharacterized protein YndB with AHSA1/START domain
MTITGTLDGPDLVLRRTVPVARDRIWRHLADPDRLATWYGTFTGDPAEGTIELTMTAEPGEPATSTWTVHACERGRLLTVSSAMGEDTWRLSVELDDAADGAGGAAGDLTRLALRHHAVTGTRVPGMDVWDEEYMSRAPEYAALVG